MIPRPTGGIIFLMKALGKEADSLPRLLFSDEKGRIFDHPYLLALGRSGRDLVLPTEEEWTTLPEMSRLFFLPGCHPIGMDPDTGDLVILESEKVGKRKVKCWAVAGFLEPGYVRTLLPAADFSEKTYVLPLWAYTAVGFKEGSYVASAFRIEEDPHWDPRNFDDREVLPKVEERLSSKTGGPLLRHLANCALVNHCFAAKNLFLQRWEAPLPVSRRCNASCLGCLSRQPKGSCPPAHRRMSFRPSVEEIVELAVEHLERAEDPIVSFGQGCEGEPLTEASLIGEAIQKIRSRTSKGTINLNTNGSMPEELAALVDRGLDSVRISLNSARPPLFRAYVRPRGFDLEDVEESLRICSQRGIFTMVNYLVFPGISDEKEEWEALRGLIERTGVKFLHLKNLCIDPELYLASMPTSASGAMGMRELKRILQEEFPDLGLGYFNKALKKGP